MSIVLDHWRQLSGAIHPLDAATFQNYQHSLNLDFPPPAFIGDIDNAPVVLLDANGGYDAVVTPSEFPDAAAVERYLDLLHNPRPIDLSTIAPYYGARNYADLIERGLLALVNAVAYRSPSISKEPDNRRVADNLPSTAIHRHWLRTELLEHARSGDRLVIAHRTRLWKLNRKMDASQGVYFTTNPVSANLSRHALSVIAEYIE